MGLSDDQRAMLRLVAQRGEQGYEDIAALKGLSVEAVRAQVAAALAQLDEEGALEGSAAAPEKPEAPAAPAPEPPQIAEPTPTAPKAQTSSPGAKPKPSPPPTKELGSSKISMPAGTGLRAAIAGAVIVVALVVIVVIVSGGGGGGDSSTASDASTTTVGSARATNSKDVTKALLEPVDGGNGKGIVVFAKVGNAKNARLAMEIAAQGLAPTASDESYTFWLARSPQQMVPFLSVKVGKGGTIAGQYEPPIEILGYLASETFTDLVLTKTDNAQLEATVKQAAAEKKTPAYTGEAVLRGTVTGPVVGAQIRQEEKEKGE